MLTLLPDSEDESKEDKPLKTRQDKKYSMRVDVVQCIKLETSVPIKQSNVKVQDRI